MDQLPITVAVGVPLDCGHRHEFWLSMLQMVHTAPRFIQPGGNLQMIWNPGDSLISRARNNIVHDFLMNPMLGQPEYLFFLDSDIGFTPEQFWQILGHRVRGIVAGQYYLKQKTPVVVANGFKDEKPDENGLLKVREAGTGFMCIHRDVFIVMKEKMSQDHWYRCDANRDMRFSFFSHGPVNQRYLSEDYLFCQRAQALGFPVLLDTKVTVKHAGWCTYPMEEPEPLPPENKDECPTPTPS